MIKFYIAKYFVNFFAQIFLPEISYLEKVSSERTKSLFAVTV